MPNYARTIIVGHLTRDWDLKYTPTGLAVAKNGVAVNEPSKGDKKVSFFDLVAFDKTAVLLAEKTGKGEAHLFDCKPQQETWETDGAKRSKVSFIVNHVAFIGGKPDAGNKPYTPASDEDLPF